MIRESLWNIVYDLRTGKFIHIHTLADPPLSQVPLRFLVDPATYFKRHAALSDENLRKRSDTLFNRFQEYMIAAVTLGDMPIQAIAPIFERINSTATPLTIVDLMRAATWDPAFDLRDSIDAVRAELTARDFGSLDRKTILRIASAAAGYGFAAEDMDRLRERNAQELAAILKDVSNASKRAVDFLSSHIKVPRAQALPYANQFAVLTEVFRQVPVPTGDQFKAIAHWFWLTTLSGYFGGWNTGQMASDYRAVTEFAKGAKEIGVSAPIPRGDVWRLTQFRSNSALSKMVALLLAFADPVDLLTGQRIDPRKSLAWNNDREFHHFFPRDYLKSKDVANGKANAAANIVMLTSASNITITNRAPSDYLGSVVRAIGRDEVLRRLSTLLVSESALDAALADDYEAFLLARSATLHQHALHLVGDTEGAPQGSSVPEGEVLVEDVIEDESDDATSDPE